jgi:hypothetical protein
MSNGMTGSLARCFIENDKDPLELKNLAADPKYAKVVAEMKALLAKKP